MDIKIAQTDHPVHELISHRWSPRAFSPQAVEKEKLQRIFEAARWAPSASNLQPWSFMLGIRGDETYTRLMDTLVEFNQLWAPTAPVLLLAMAKKTNHKGEINRAALYDLGQAVSYLTFQAAYEGLYVHQMGGFDTEKAAVIFNIPDDHSIATVIAIGYRGNPEVLHENLKKMEIASRERKRSSEFVFSGTFGSISTIL